MFFAPLDVYQPAGMFTYAHLQAVIVCVISLIMCLYGTKDMKKGQLMTLTKVMAVSLTLLELIKVGYNFYYGYTWLDAWLPLSFCSLFIYALWFSGFGKGKLKQVGDAYILIGCLIGGVSFLVMPTTSLMRYPIGHYLCLYSLFFHVTMIYFGLMYVKHQVIVYKKETVFAFIKYFMSCAFISIMINTLSGANIMLLREPYNIPITVLQRLQEVSPISYTILAIEAYLLGSIGTSYMIYKRLTLRFNISTYYASQIEEI